MPTHVIDDDIEVWAPPGRAPLLKPEETSRYLRIALRTLIDWRENGVGPHWIRVGPKDIRYPLDEIDAYIATRRRVPAERPDGTPAPSRTAA